MWEDFSCSGVLNGIWSIDCGAFFLRYPTAYNAAQCKCYFCDVKNHCFRLNFDWSDASCAKYPTWNSAVLIRWSFCDWSWMWRGIGRCDASYGTDPTWSTVEVVEMVAGPLGRSCPHCPTHRAVGRLDAFCATNPTHCNGSVCDLRSRRWGWDGQRRRFVVRRE